MLEAKASRFLVETWQKRHAPPGFGFELCFELLKILLLVG